MLPRHDRPRHPSSHMLQILGASQDHGSSEDPVQLLLGCHTRIRTFTALAARLSSEEPAPDADVAKAAHRVHRYYSVALPLHEADEELSIAPRLQRGAPAELGEALLVMKRQHLELDAMLAGLLPLWRLIADEPRRRSDLSPGMAREVDRMEELWAQHLTKEEELIFPAMRRLLDTSELARITVEMRERRAPAPSTR